MKINQLRGICLEQHRYFKGSPAPPGYTEAHMTHLDGYMSRYLATKHTQAHMNRPFSVALTFLTESDIKPKGEEACTRRRFRLVLWTHELSLAETKWCHLTENHGIVPLRLLGNCNWTGIAMQHNSCLHNWTIKILKRHYFGHIHLNKGSSASQHVFFQLG